MKILTPILLVGLLAGPLLCIGCRSMTYVTPAGERFTHRSLGTKTEIASLDVIATKGATNEVLQVVLRGYSQDQVEAIRVAVEVAVQTAIETMCRKMGIPTQATGEAPAK